MWTLMNPSGILCDIE